MSAIHSQQTDFQTLVSVAVIDTLNKFQQELEELQHRIQDAVTSNNHFLVPKEDSHHLLNRVTKFIHSLDVLAQGTSSHTFRNLHNKIFPFYQIYVATHALSHDLYSKRQLRKCIMIRNVIQKLSYPLQSKIIEIYNQKLQDEHLSHFQTQEKSWLIVRPELCLETLEILQKEKVEITQDQKLVEQAIDSLKQARTLRSKL